MKNLNMRSRVELAIPAALAYMAVNGYVTASCRAHEREATEEEQNVCSLLKIASHEPLNGLSDKDAQTVMRRMDRVSKSVIMDYKGGAFGKIYPAIYLFTEMLIRDGHIEVIAGGPFAVAMDAMNAAFNEDAETLDAEGLRQKEAMDRSAEKAAPKMLLKCQSLGYYK